jgi:hypothetical protein
MFFSSYCLHTKKAAGRSFPALHVSSLGKAGLLLDQKKKERNDNDAKRVMSSNAGDSAAGKMPVDNFTRAV